MAHLVDALTPDLLESKIRAACDGDFLREPDWSACIELSDALNANRALCVSSHFCLVAFQVEP
jgi:hypothetical protein